MNSIVTIIMAAVIFAAVILISSLLGLSVVTVLYHFFLPGLIAAIHVVSMIALFKESKRRIEDGEILFASLDAPFWAMTGLAFGVLGLLAFRLINDYPAGRPNQSR